MKNFKIESITENRIVSSLIHLILGQDDDYIKLYKDSEYVGKLRSIYGHFPFDIARNIASEDYSRAYKSIDIFGFEFSTRRYPMAILVCSLILSLGVFSTILIAHKKSALIFSDVVEEDIVHVFIGNSISRSLLWIILPPLSVWIAFPDFPLISLEVGLLYAGIGILVILGLVSTISARNL